MNWNNNWNEPQYIIKLKFEKKIPDTIIRGLNNEVSLEIAIKDEEYYISIRNNVHGMVTAGITLTRDEFNHIAHEVYKLWEPTNIVDALNKCGQNNSK